MGVSLGYKQTEAGLIPEDWEVFSLREIGKFKNGINKGSEDFGHGSPFVNLMDVFGIGSISTSEQLGFVASSNSEQAAYDLRRGDVIFVRSSVKPSGVGLTAVVESDLARTVYSGFLIRFRDNGFIDIGFKKHCFYEERFRSALIGSSSVSANTNISQESLKRLMVPLPPTKAEQRSIAEALSDADALIESLGQLLAKKRQIKHGTMQELFAGKKRLPGFNGEVAVRSLGGLATMASGGTPISSIDAYYDGHIPWVSISDMTRGGKYLCQTDRNLTSAGLANCAAQMFQAGTVLYAMYASLGECSIAGVDVCTSQAILGIRPSKDLDSEFLYYWLSSLKSTVRAMGQHGTQANLNKGMVQALQIRLPKLPEQIAVASVLSDMDKEMDALEAKLVKVRQLKQGMMQELLSGRIRLV